VGLHVEELHEGIELHLVELGAQLLTALEVAVLLLNVRNLFLWWEDVFIVLFLLASLLLGGLLFFLSFLFAFVFLFIFVTLSLILVNLSLE
jgi:hypothetical protein